MRNWFRRQSKLVARRLEEIRKAGTWADIYGVRIWNQEKEKA